METHRRTDTTDLITLVANAVGKSTLVYPLSDSRVETYAGRVGAPRKYKKIYQKMEQTERQTDRQAVAVHITLQARSMDNDATISCTRIDTIRYEMLF